MFQLNRENYYPILFTPPLSGAAVLKKHAPEKGGEQWADSDKKRDYFFSVSLFSPFNGSPWTDTNDFAGTRTRKGAERLQMSIGSSTRTC